MAPAPFIPDPTPDSTRTTAKPARAAHHDNRPNLTFQIRLLIMRRHPRVQSDTAPNATNDAATGNTRINQPTCCTRTVNFPSRY